MPVCAVSNPSWATSPIINPTPTNVAFDMTTNATMHFTIENNQTVYFVFNLVNTTPSLAANIQIGIYSATTFSLVAQLNSSTTFIESNIDLPLGTYIVCMRSIRGSFTGTAKADYYGFSRNVTFDVRVSHGESVKTELKTEPKRKPCDKPMKWELVEGHLPDGLTIEPFSGMIHGTLPILDCTNDDPDYNNFPSANMYFKTLETFPNSSVYSWGRQWKFKLKISMVDQPQNYEEKWFCISILNDFSRTTRKFFENYENGNTIGEVIKDTKDKDFVFGLCPPDPCNTIDKPIDEVIDNDVIKDWDGVTIDDDITYIDIPNVNTIKDDDNTLTYTQYEVIYGKVTKRPVNIKLESIKTACKYNNHYATIDMDQDVIDLGNIKVVDKGYTQETITIELDNYEHYLVFREWALAHRNTDERIIEYKDSELFNLFLMNSDKVLYGYIHYDPVNGYTYDGVSYGVSQDDLGIGDEKHFIYIEMKVDDLPEPKLIQDITKENQAKVPTNIVIYGGETMSVTIHRWEW